MSNRSATFGIAAAFEYLGELFFCEFLGKHARDVNARRWSLRQMCEAVALSGDFKAFCLNQHKAAYVAVALPSMSFMELFVKEEEKHTRQLLDEFCRENEETDKSPWALYLLRMLQTSLAPKVAQRIVSINTRYDEMHTA